ncbi:hypothetical protein FRC00_004685 [Tulasnella sp. 408]|nr:hypothetical protein FRC00_004685 [Tulasnella sp. 408]
MRSIFPATDLTTDAFKGKKVVIVSVPGAFTITAISDTYAKWSESMGLSVDLTEGGMGVRSARYVLILDDLKVVSIEREPGRGLTNTDADTTLSKL